MSYRIGIDVGGTFTDLVLARPDGAIALAQESDHAGRPVASACSTASGCSPSGEGLDAAASCWRAPAPIVHGTTTADNTMIEMSGAVTGLITTAGPSRRDRAAARLQGGHLGSGDPAAAADRAAPPPHRRARAARLRGPGGHAARRGGRARGAAPAARSRAPSRWRWCSCSRSSTRAHERRVREIAAEECPSVARLALARGDAVGAGVRAHQHDAGERLRRAEDRALPAAPGRAAARRRLRARAAGDAVERRHHDARVHRAPAGHDAQLRARPAASSPPARSAAAAGPRDFVCADMGGTSYDVCLIRGGAAGDQGGLELAPPLPGRAADGRHPFDRRRRRLDRLGGRGRAAGRPAQRRRAARARSATAAAAREVTVTDANLLLGYLNPGDFCGGRMTPAAPAGVREAMRGAGRRSRSASTRSRRRTGSTGW